MFAWSDEIQGKIREKYDHNKTCSQSQFIQLPQWLQTIPSISANRLLGVSKQRQVYVVGYPTERSFFYALHYCVTITKATAQKTFLATSWKWVIVESFFTSATRGIGFVGTISNHSLSRRTDATRLYYSLKIKKCFSQDRKFTPNKLVFTSNTSTRYSQAHVFWAYWAELTAMPLSITI